MKNRMGQRWRVDEDREVVIRTQRECVEISGQHSMAGGWW